MFLNSRTWGFVWDKDLLRGIITDIYILFIIHSDHLMTSYNQMLCLCSSFLVLYWSRLSLEYPDFNSEQVNRLF